ncbi:hypothetical protein IJE86_02270 [bacterium]|nr:hypothetical protein [bacterium]
MISVEDFIKKILQKKNWSITKFTEEINKVKKQAGIKSITRKQNVSNYLNDINKPLGIRTLISWEKALGLPDDTLCNMVEQPQELKTKREIEDLKKRVRNQ